MKYFYVNATLLLMVFITFLGGAAYAGTALTGSPVIIGLDAEFGHKTSTSDDAVRAGILVAIDEINATGGVLGGRPLKLEERDNRSVPSRGVRNLKEFAQVKDLVAVFCAKQARREKSGREMREIAVMAY